MQRVLAFGLLLVLGGGCTTAPHGSYYPDPRQPETRVLAEALYRAAAAAGDDPARYSFALLSTKAVVSYSTEDATFYFSEGLGRQAVAIVDALVAAEVAHEVLGHAGQRRALSLGLSAGFTVLGIVIPGAGLLDLAVNPLIVRAFTRDQKIAADLRAIEILNQMRYADPARVLAHALRTAAAQNGATPSSGLLAVEPTLDERLAAIGQREVLPPSKRE